MAVNTIRLPKHVPGESLEEACIKAAKDLGWKAKPKDRFEIDYSLGSVHKEDRYKDTRIRMRRIFSMFDISGIEKGKTTDYFFIVPWRVSERKLEEYLAKVSEYI